MDISLKLGFLDKRKVIFLVPRYYVGISSKGMSTSMNLKTINMPENKQKGKVSTTDAFLKNLLKYLGN